MPLKTRESQQIWRVIDILKWGERFFSNGEFDNPRKEIEILGQRLLNCKRVDLYLRFEEPLTKNQLAILRDWVKRRKNHEPSQYITGKAGFYNIELDITPNVLIPRPESEILVEQVLKRFSEKSALIILDIGCGSGCITLALAKELPNAKVVGIDNSVEAVNLAKQNAEKLQINNVKFIVSDFLKDDIDGKFDIIVSNPPYIPQADIDGLMHEVRDFEPHSALTDFNDGLTFYHKFVKKNKNLLKAGGWFFAEVGLGKQPELVKKLFSNEEYNYIELIKDYNGDERVLIARIK